MSTLWSREVCQTGICTFLILEHDATGHERIVTWRTCPKDQMDTVRTKLQEVLFHPTAKNLQAWACAGSGPEPKV